MVALVYLCGIAMLRMSWSDFDLRISRRVDVRDAISVVLGERIACCVAMRD